MSVPGSIAFALFMTFPLYPLIYLARLLLGARTRAPIVAIAYHAQSAAFVAVSGWFLWRASPALEHVRPLGLTSSVPTAFMVALSELVHTPFGALIALAVAAAALRLSGKLLARGWRRPEVPAWRLDALALLVWMELALLLSLQVLAVLLPLVVVVD